MNQINVNPGREPVETVDTSGDRSAAAGINLITVLIVLVVLAVIAWYLFTGPLRAMGGNSTTNINVTNPQPTTSVNVNPPSQPNAPAPGGNTGNTGGTTGNTGGTTGNTGGTTGNTGGTTGGNNPPANP
jgi:hypothetical protein